MASGEVKILASVLRLKEQTGANAMAALDLLRLRLLNQSDEFDSRNWSTQYDLTDVANEDHSGDSASSVCLDDPAHRESFLSSLRTACSDQLPGTEKQRVRILRELNSAGFRNPRVWQTFAAIRFLSMTLPLFAC
ncbi:MAG: hypothetical protein IH831_10955, partial [Planctomycetes bacterium]|nr:hypothetical protein [Planctomycetota bacterium]